MSDLIICFLSEWLVFCEQKCNLLVFWRESHFHSFWKSKVSELLTVALLLWAIVQVALYKRATWAIPSCLSLPKEWLERFPPVAHYKRVTWAKIDSHLGIKRGKNCKKWIAHGRSLKLAILIEEWRTKEQIPNPALLLFAFSLKITHFKERLLDREERFAHGRSFLKSDKSDLLTVAL